MEQSKQLNQEDGMVIDGFSSDQEQYIKDDHQIQQAKRLQQQKIIKEEIKAILSPPQQIKTKAYSLMPDKINGWALKAEEPNPIPITFGNKAMDNLINLMLTNPSKKFSVVYLGPRYQNTFYAWRDKPFKFPYSHINMPKNIKYKKRSFLGQNPDIQDSVYFDSIFESGNLDIAIQVDRKQYDLYLRVDSNTRGHFNWFNFKVKNMKAGERYKFNISNLQRGFCLYSRGMKPYMRSLKLKNAGWKQSGENVSYLRVQNRAAKYYGLELKKKFNLSFQIQTEIQNDQIQISYCVPYTFSKQLKVLQEFKILCEKKKFFKESILCNSLGGLPIPLLTITEPEINQSDSKKKKCILVCGRVHPGQSNGSFMVEGFLKFICGESKTAQTLRKYIVFKVVPMINPDGVVMGNYRTGLSGKDFNREYRNPDKDIFPEVYSFKKLVTETKIHFKNNLLMFLDFHGHSQKKNVFAYGPQFPLIDKYYYESRIFAKILEKENQIFRYHSCVFKVSECKLSTARAILLRKINIPLTYTIEASNGFYHDKQTLKSVPFLSHQWVKMGHSIAMAIHQYIQCLINAEKIREQRQIAKHQSSKIKHQFAKIKSPNHNTSFVSRAKATSIISAREDAKIKKIYDQIIRQQKQPALDPTSDDDISEGVSDKQDEKDDLSKKQLQTLFNSIKNNNKLGKNKKSKTNKLSDLDFLDQQQQEIEKETYKEEINKINEIKTESLRKLSDKIHHNRSQISEQVLISNKQSIFIGYLHQRNVSPPKYFTERKHQKLRQFKAPVTTPKIINCQFETHKQKTDMLETIALFPDFRNKNKKTIIVDEPFSPTKNQKSVIIGNISNPQSFKFERISNAEKNSIFGRRNSQYEKSFNYSTLQNSYQKFSKSLYRIEGTNNRTIHRQDKKWIDQKKNW